MAELNALRHGHCKDGRESETYRSWKAMRRRCGATVGKNYANYAGKGISVCASWESFDAFLEDMGTRPEGATIERIDGSLGYSKQNCRWATRLDQNRNRSNNVLTENAANEIYRRAWSGESHRLIAADFGCSIPLVSNIKTGRVWRDVTISD